MDKPFGSTWCVRTVSLTNMAASAPVSLRASVWTSNNTSAVQVKNDVEVMVDADCGRKVGDVRSLELVWSCRTKS